MVGDVVPHPDQIEVFEEWPVEHVHPDDRLLVVIAGCARSRRGKNQISAAGGALLALDERIAAGIGQNRPARTSVCRCCGAWSPGL